MNFMEHTFRNLTVSEIDTLIAQGCCAENWSDVTVAEGFDASKVWHVRMSGKIRIGEDRGVERRVYPCRWSKEILRNKECHSAQCNRR